MSRPPFPLLLLLSVWMLAAGPAQPTGTPPVRQTAQPGSRPAGTVPGSQPNSELTLDLGNGVKMELVLVPAGEFMMGGSPGEKDRKFIGGPAHKVTIAQPFYMGKYEVTNRQYRCFRAEHNSKNKEGQDLNGDDQPVVLVSWCWAQLFCQWLSKKTGRQVSLPSEAEWEYAARGGDERMYVWGNAWPPPKGAGNLLDDSGRKYSNVKAIEGYADGFPVTAPVGRFAPNPYGLYDLEGNVMEWCRDVYHDTYTGAPATGAAWDGHDFRNLIRGGSWSTGDAFLRISERRGYYQFDYGDFIGFRVVVHGKEAPGSGPLYAATGSWPMEWASYGTPSSQPNDRAYPRAWNPPARMPIPQERMPIADWKERFKKARATLPPLDKADDDRPALGVKITKVARDSRAAVLGFEAGDCIIAIDDQPVAGRWDYQRQRLDRTQSFKLWSPQWGVRSVNAGRGLLGFEMEDQWEPGLAYLRAKKEHNPAWDEWVRLAGAFWERDETLAETALFHAYQAGYRGWALPAIMTSLARAHGRANEALDWGHFALQSIPQEYRPAMVRACCEAAVMGNRLELADEIGKKEKKIQVFRPEFKPEPILRQLEAMTLEQKNLLPPCEAAWQVTGKIADLEGLDFLGRDLASWYKDHRCFVTKVPSDGYYAGLLGPAARNLSVYLDYDIRPHQLPTTIPAGSYNTRSRMTMQLVDVDAESREAFLTVELTTDGQCGVAASNYAPLEFRSDRLTGTGHNRLEMAILGPWCEVRLNGRQVFRGATSDLPQRKLGCRFTFSGVYVQVYNFTLRNLGDAPMTPVLAGNRPAPASAPAKPLVVPPAKNALAAWYREAMVQGYLAHGQRNPAWDPAALKALTLYAQVSEKRVSMYGELLAESEQAVRAGCDDPLVLSAYASALGFLNGPSVKSTKLYRQAAEKVRITKYSPNLKVGLLLDAAEDAKLVSKDLVKPGKDADLPPDVQRGANLVQEAVQLMPQALAEAKCPNDVLLEAMARILSHAFSDKADTAEKMLDQLCAMIDQARPRSVLGPCLQAKYHISAAWKARGGRWGSTVTDAGWKQFSEHLEAAAEACEAAWKIDPNDAQAPTLMLTIALGHKEAQEKIDLWLQRALQNNPNNEAAVTARLWSLRPRWGGSLEEMAAFGRRCFEQAKNGPLDPELCYTLVWAHKGISEDLTPDNVSPLEKDIARQEYWNSAKVWKDVQNVFEELLRHFPDSTYYRSLYACYACQCGQWATAHEQFQRLGEAAACGPFGSATEMKKMRAQAERETRAGTKN